MIRVKRTNRAAEPTAAPEAEPTVVEPTLPPSPTPVAVDTFDAAAAGDRTVVKWFVGLGSGGQPKQIEAERAVVDAFNASQDKIYLSLQIVDNTVASTTLATQIAKLNEQLKEAKAEQARITTTLGQLPSGSAAHKRYLGKFEEVDVQIDKMTSVLKEKKETEIKDRAAHEAMIRGLTAK